MDTENHPKAQIFSLKTPLLSTGQTKKVVAGTGLLKVRVKVYAEGGENALHAHFDEDHSFIILQGQATFYDKEGNTNVVNQYEGIMLPKGTYYYFQSTGNENLVLLRVGAGRKPGDENRLGTQGRPLTAEENKRIPGVPIPGEFFGG